MRTGRDVAEEWERWPGTMRSFTRMLEREGVPHLSFSMVNALESCPQRYFLEYVEKVRPRDEPIYFIKGRLLHQAAAGFHRARGRGRGYSVERLLSPTKRGLEQDDLNHVRNAMTLMRLQAEDDWSVVAVEEPFVLDLGPDLPACLGIVDLIERREDVCRVIDHKSGKRFYDSDRLQLVLYWEHVRRRYGAAKCHAFYDQYRWVNNLERVRKPAWRRTRVNIRSGSWNTALRRLAARYKEMKVIEEAGDAPGSGSCDYCYLRDRCPKAFFGYGYSWY